jgi:hypothetical protein
MLDMRRWGPIAAAAVALAAPVAQAKAPLQVGAVTPELLTRKLVPGTVADLRAANLADVARVTLTWRRGQTDLDLDLLADLRYGIDAAERVGADVYLAVYPAGSAATPLTFADQGTFAQYAAWLVKRLPAVEHVIVGNEPNLNRFWLPQFGAGGTDLAAPAYVRLLARTYDALKAASPAVEVVGGALAHRGSDIPATGRDTHSPVTFILDMGKAYRASGRTKPIMDALAYHPYLEQSDFPPTYQHLLSKTITIGDYGKLVSVLRRAFDGTNQAGSTLPIVYAEFGVESRVPQGLESLYTGIEPATTHPVDEDVQARYYAQAMQMAACQPTVRTFMVFRLIDSPLLSDWQSGVYYADGKPKSSRTTIAAAAGRARAGAVTGCAALLAPKPLVSFFPRTRPGPNIGVRPLLLRCNEDCDYTIRLARLSGATTPVAEFRGKLIAGETAHPRLPRVRLSGGYYRLSMRVTAADYTTNAFRASRVFRIRR